MKHYRVFVTPPAWDEIKDLPKKVRNRIKKFITALAESPRPAKTKSLDVPGLQVEVRRWRWDCWRVLYAITEAEETVDVLAVRKRPPYDYGDLEEMLQDYPAD